MISKNASGRLNEVDRPIISKIIHLNTKFRDNYYNTSSSDYFYKFPVEIKKAISVRIHSIDIPNTWYTFSDRLGNNTFIIEMMIGGSSVFIYEIRVPEGNYSATELVKYLNM